MEFFIIGSLICFVLFFPKSKKRKCYKVTYIRPWGNLNNPKFYIEKI